MLKLPYNHIPDDLKQYFTKPSGHWIHRNNIIWHKRDAMPASAIDRFTVDFEDIMFFTKNPKYYFEQQFEKATGKPSPRKADQRGDQNVAVPYDRAGNPNGDQRNMRCVQDVITEGTDEEHYASYPIRLINRWIVAGCPEQGIVLDPFLGTATTAVCALKLNRQYIGIELQPDYYKIAQRRLALELCKGRLF